MMKYVLSTRLGALAGGLLGLTGLFLLAGCATTDNAAPPARTTQARPLASKGPDGGVPWESVDALRVGELVLIEFSGVGDPPPKHEERIKTDGRITLPSIGAVQAAGKSRGELEEEIHKRYVPNYYRQLTVVVRNEGRFFYVAGQVKNPSQYPYLKEMTVLKAIASAGGFTDFAKKSKVLVTRADGRKLTVNCNKALGNQKLDVPIYPDDTIEVPRRLW